MEGFHSKLERSEDDKCYKCLIQISLYKAFEVKNDWGESGTWRSGMYK